MRAASPLALYQLRIGIASRGSGQLSAQQRESARRLKEGFFPRYSGVDLEPRIEPLYKRPR